MWLSEKERAQVFSELHVDRAGLNNKGLEAARNEIEKKSNR